MKRQIIVGLQVLLFSQAGAGQETVTRAAARYVPGVSWRAKSVVTADFTCRGRMQTAILGVSPSEIVVAVFLNGTNSRPEVLPYYAKVRDPDSATLKTEGLDYDPKEDPGYHESLRFDDWVR